MHISKAVEVVIIVLEEEVLVDVEVLVVVLVELSCCHEACIDETSVICVLKMSN